VPGCSTQGGRESGHSCWPAATDQAQASAWPSALWRGCQAREREKAADLCCALALWRVGEGDVLGLYAPARTSYSDVDVHLGYGSSVATGNCSTKSMHVPVCPEASRSSVAWPYGTPAWRSCLGVWLAGGQQRAAACRPWVSYPAVWRARLERHRLLRGSWPQGTSGLRGECGWVLPSSRASTGSSRSRRAELACLLCSDWSPWGTGCLHAHAAPALLAIDFCH